MQRKEALERLQVALAVVSFFKNFAELATKYRGARENFERSLDQESLHTGIPVNCLARGMSRIVLGQQFAENGIAKLRAKHLEIVARKAAAGALVLWGKVRSLRNQIIP